ncbi:Hypothetical protein MIP_07661 [Mycobacterium intracellulare subsp. intracellulare MTCC 9506]|uniref:Uncharacterized protein n=1 Tax=Mycobacterium indicus pranii (strain DSM 45239 / MTCC 9506) TaxID=1232724 RepID=J9WJF4_MYCIP|nr:hypothetical protein OCQ_51630 [Mycobacterium paraintracellulare]AFS17145.1 Hypothetical protein MIP_07661 [Mycobacterium intracellulare subsp. intracellulare MTCC 9506]
MRYPTARLFVTFTSARRPRKTAVVQLNESAHGRKTKDQL